MAIENTITKLAQHDLLTSAPVQISSIANRQPGSGDTVLLGLCARFIAAHSASLAANASPHTSDDAVTAISARWYRALAAVLNAPAPTSESGRLALAKAAHVALADLIHDGFEEAPEASLALRALALFAEG